MESCLYLPFPFILTDPCLPQDGGAFLVAGSSSVNMSSVFLLSNEAGYYGGAVSCVGGSTCRTTNSHAISNSATSRGGAFYVNAASCDLDNVAFFSNIHTGDR